MEEELTSAGTPFHISWSAEPGVSSGRAGEIIQSAGYLRLASPINIDISAGAIYSAPLRGRKDVSQYSADPIVALARKMDRNPRILKAMQIAAERCSPHGRWRRTVNAIKEWSSCYLFETLFWLSFCGALFFTPDWYRYEAYRLSISEMVTLLFAIGGYFVFGAWVRKKFIDKYLYRRYASRHPSYFQEDILELIKKRKEDEPVAIGVIGIMFVFFLVVIWGEQIYRDW